MTKVTIIVRGVTCEKEYRGMEAELLTICDEIRKDEFGEMATRHGKHTRCWLERTGPGSRE